MGQLLEALCLIFFWGDLLPGDLLRKCKGKHYFNMAFLLEGPVQVKNGLLLNGLVSIRVRGGGTASAATTANLFIVVFVVVVLVLVPQGGNYAGRVPPKQ